MEVHGARGGCRGQEEVVEVELEQCSGYLWLIQF